MEKLHNDINLCHSDEGRISSLILFFRFLFFYRNSVSPLNLKSRNDNLYQFKISLKILLIIFSALIFSCQKSSISTKPEILTAQYEIVTRGEFERGYNIYIEANGYYAGKLIKGIVINHKLLKANIFFNKVMLDDDEKPIKATLDRYFPINSMTIINFSPPKTDSRSDGIIFEMNGEEYFQEIKFKLK